MRGSFSFDAVVIGGGPAGALAAMLLARQGWNVALLEREPRHRAKTCGHCLNPRVRPLLQSIGLLEQIEAIALGITTTLEVRLAGRAPLVLPIGGGSADAHGRVRREPGLLIERSQLDQFLIDAAGREGVVVLQPATGTVVGAEHRPIAVHARLADRTIVLVPRLVVGADGLRSRVARFLRRGGRTSAGRKYGFSMDVSPPAAEAFDRETISMFVTGEGYLGIVNQGAGVLHVAALVNAVRSGTPSVSRDPVSFCRRMAGRFPELAEIGLANMGGQMPPRLIATGPMPWSPRVISTDRAALVGDAAGYVEPFTGEGMSWSMESAAALAEAAQSARPGTWTEPMARRYGMLWRRRVGGRQRTCRWLAGALERPRIVRLARSLGAAQPRLARHFIDRVVLA